MIKEDFLISIITPYYNTLQQTKELAEKLKPQLNDNIQWIIVDDGCHEQELDNLPATVIHLEKNSGCAGIPRNYGLDAAKGKYITFIDSDDMISSKFIEKITDKINNSDFDYCFMSWKKQGGYYIDVTNGRPEWNCSVWGVVYKKEIIGDNRFNEKRIAEDYDFNQAVLKGKEERITDCLYVYRTHENGIMATYKS